MCLTSVGRVSISCPTITCQIPPITSSTSSGNLAIHQLQLLQRSCKTNKWTCKEELKSETLVKTHSLLAVCLVKALIHCTWASRSRVEGLSLRTTNIRIKTRTLEVTTNLIWQIWMPAWLLRQMRDLHLLVRLPMGSNRAMLCKNVQEGL